MSISIVIPARNEGASLDLLLPRLKEAVPGAEIVVVNDGSADGTAAISIKHGALVVGHPYAKGNGAAVKTGARSANGEVLVFMDADGQHRPEDIPKLLTAHRRWPGRPIIAARLERREFAPPLRRFANGMADFWVSWAAGCPIADTQSGFRLYPAELLRRAAGPEKGRRGFAFESALLIEAGRQGRYPIAVAIETIYHPHGRPSHYRPWRDTLRIVDLVARSLFRSGMYPVGLLRSLRLLPLPADRDEGHFKQTDSEEKK